MSSGAGLHNPLSQQLASVIEGMTGDRPDVTVRNAASAPPDLLWYGRASTWLGAAEDAWLAVGGWVLSTAGIQAHEPVDARNTWLEIASQTLGGSATESPPPPGGEALELEISAAGHRWNIWLVHESMPAPSPKGYDLLMDVELPVSVSFGRAQLQLKDVLKLTTGSIVELNRTIGEPVEVIVNNCVIARGEVVVIEGNYGVRIQEIVSRENRMRTLA